MLRADYTKQLTESFKKLTELNDDECEQVKVGLFQIKQEIDNVLNIKSNNSIFNWGSKSQEISPANKVIIQRDVGYLLNFCNYCSIIASDEVQNFLTQNTFFQDWKDKDKFNIGINKIIQRLLKEMVIKNENKLHTTIRLSHYETDKEKSNIYFAIMGELIDENAELINDQDDEGNTPLHLAIVSKNIEAVKFILGHDPDLNIVNDENLSALQLADAKLQASTVVTMTHEGSSVYQDPIYFDIKSLISTKMKELMKGNEVQLQSKRK